MNQLMTNLTDEINLNPLVADGISNCEPTAYCGYYVQVSCKTDDRDWDEFLARIPGSNFVQTGMWAEVKSILGWENHRFMVRHKGQIVAGAQLSMRRIAMGFIVGIVSKGPVLVTEDPLLASLVINEMIRIAMEHDVRCLAVQPPFWSECLTQCMREKGFHPITMEWAPTATIQIDLEKGLDDILAGMKKNTRRSIRHGLRSGIICREGTDDELSTFYRLLMATSERQKWPTYSKEYFSEIMRVLGQHGHAKLFFAEYRGEAVSSQMLIGFGDTVRAKNCGWSGQHKNLGPNNVLEWFSIQWAKDHGYRYYDLEGITRKTVMQEKLHGDICDNEKDSWSYYKLQYGGEVKLFPQAQIYIANPLARWVYSKILSKFENRRITQTILDRVRLR